MGWRDTGIILRGCRIVPPVRAVIGRIISGVPRRPCLGSTIGRCRRAGCGVAVVRRALDRTRGKGYTGIAEGSGVCVLGCVLRLRGTRSSLNGQENGGGRNAICRDSIKHS